MNADDNDDDDNDADDDDDDGDDDDCDDADDRPGQQEIVGNCPPEGCKAIVDTGMQRRE